MPVEILYSTWKFNIQNHSKPINCKTHFYNTAIYNSIKTNKIRTIQILTDIVLT